MKTLFYMITAVVFILVRLIAPDAFDAEDVNITSQLAQEIIQDTGINESDLIQKEIVTAVSTGNVNIQTDDTASMPESTAVPVRDDPKTALQKMLENPKVTDNFEQGSSGFGINAGLNDDDSIRIVALNNKLSLEPKKNNGWLSWRLRPPVFKDGAAEMEFAITTCARGDRTGLMLHATDYTGGHGYYFSLSCEGTVSILKDSVILGSSDARTVFKNSSGETNVMTGLIEGDNLTLMLNGQQVLTVQDATYPEGFSGFFTAPQNTGSLTMDIQSYKIYLTVDSSILPS